MTERELAEALEHESGLRGLAGSGDMREVLAATARDEPAAVRLSLPAGWAAEPGGRELELGPGAEATTRFRLTAGPPSLRARIGADLTVGALRLGEQAEALVEVVCAGATGPEPER